MPATPASSWTITVVPRSSARILASWTTGPVGRAARDDHDEPARFGQRPLHPDGPGQLVLLRLGDRGPHGGAHLGRARVTRVLDAPASSSARAMATTCSTVLPSPRITSGPPCRSSRWVSTFAKPRARKGRFASRSVASAVVTPPEATASRSSSISARRVTDAVYAGPPFRPASARVRESPGHGRLAQPEERLPYKEKVGGSSPSAPTERSRRCATRTGCSHGDGRLGSWREAASHVAPAQVGSSGHQRERVQPGHPDQQGAVTDDERPVLQHTAGDRA